MRFAPKWYQSYTNDLLTKELMMTNPVKLSDQEMADMLLDAALASGEMLANADGTFTMPKRGRSEAKRFSDRTMKLYIPMLRERQAQGEPVLH
jgi:hypothetical protein